MKKIVCIIVYLLVAVVSVAVIAPAASNPDNYQGFMDTLDEKRNTILELTGSAAIASVALAAIPDDSTTPIADEIMNLTGYFVIILCAILLEKYLLTLTGLVTFKFMIPLACGLLILNSFLKLKVVRKFAVKLVVFGIVLVAIVPCSLIVSDYIEDIHNSSINATIEEAKSVEKDAKEESTEISEAEESADKESEEDQGIFESIGDKFSDAKDAIKDKISDTVDSITEVSEEILTKAEDLINDLTETIVVMIVTTCVIPIVVLLFFVWFAKSFIAMDIDLDKLMERTDDKRNDMSNDRRDDNGIVNEMMDRKEANVNLLKRLKKIKNDK